MKTREKRIYWRRATRLVVLFCGFVFILNVFNIKEPEKEKKLWAILDQETPANSDLKNNVYHRKYVKHEAWHIMGQEMCFNWQSVCLFTQRTDPQLPQSQPSNSAPHVVVTPNHKVMLLPLHNWNLATVVNRDVNICVSWSCMISVKGSFDPSKYIHHGPYVENHWPSMDEL